MCVAVPGRIVAIREPGPNQLGPIASIELQGNRIEASLVMTPDASVGSWVLVHAGFAISELDEAQARETWDYLRQLEPSDGSDQDA